MEENESFAAAFEAPQVPRPLVGERFEQLVAECLSKPIVLVRAPAGCGKTTLLRALAEEATRNGESVVWCRPDGGLREPGVLIPALVLRLGYAVSGCPEPAALLAEAVCCAVKGGALMLVLDDAHEYDADSEVWPALERLVRIAPVGFRLAVASRQDIPIRAGRAQANGLLVNIDAAHLRLTPAEVKSLIGAETGHEPPEAVSRGVWERTAGWPACVRLVAGCARQKGVDGLAAVLSQRAAIPDHVYSFFAEELMAVLPATTLEAMKSLSVLAVFDRAMASRLCSASEVDNVVDWALRLGAVDAVTNTRESYHFHPLFRDFLLGQLQGDGPGALEEASRESALALLEVGELEGAIDQCLAAGDIDAAAELIEEVAPSLMRSGKYGKAEEWLDQLPASLLVERPALLLRAAELDGICGRPRMAVEKLSTASRLFLAASDTRNAAECMLACAVHHLEMGSPTRMKAVLTECGDLDCSDQPEVMWRLLSLEGILAAHAADVCGAEELLQQSVTCAARGGPDALANAIARLGVLDAVVIGDQRRALARYTAAEREAARQSDVERTLYVLSNKAVVLAGSGEYRLARACLSEGLRLALERGVMSYDSYLLSNLALTSAGEGDLGCACQKYGEALKVCEQQEAALDRGWGLHELAQVVRARGSHVRALHLSLTATETCEGSENAYTLYPARIEHLACLVSRNPTPDLAADLASLAADCGEKRLLGNQARALYHQGRCLLLLGDEDAAKALLADALALAHELSHFHYFIVEAHGDPTTLIFALDVGAEAGVAKYILDRTEKSVRKTLLEWLGGRAGDAAIARALRLVHARKVTDPRVIAAAAKHVGRDYGDGPFALAPGLAAMRIRTFGTFSVEVDGRFMEKGDWVKARARELLRMLVAQPGLSLPRDKVLAQFWPDRSTAGALNCCNVLVNNLKRSLEPEAEPRSVSRFIVWDEGVYSLLPGSTWVDSAAYDAAVSEGESALRRGDIRVARDRLAQADALYAGDYMADDLYGDMFFSARERYRQGHLKVLERLVELDSRDGGKAHVAHHLRRLTELDPYSEDVWARLIRCHLDAGDRKGAREAYRQCVRILGEGDDQELPPEILQLKKQLAGPKRRSRPSSSEQAVPAVGERAAKRRDRATAPTTPV